LRNLPDVGGGARSAGSRVENVDDWEKSVKCQQSFGSTETALKRSMSLSMPECLEGCEE
jgi:hypothetical protein